MTRRDTPPALLTVASYYGTLAAARCLGRAGIPVIMGGAPLLAPARWSSYVTRNQPCPPIEEPEQFVEWLVRFGEREPGSVLYPTSDEVAWLLSQHRDILAPHYRLFQPSFDTLRRLLDKRELFAMCQQVGLSTPTTYFPSDSSSLQEIADRATFPLLIKPNTQVLLRSHHKGTVVPDRSALEILYEDFMASNHYDPYVLAQASDVDRPMLQEFHPGAAVGIYSIAGFIGQTDGAVALASRKILQRPRRLGIGLCFEEARLHHELVERLTALCRAVGYHGVFEAEFIEVDDAYMLIDFNPRYYSQMTFEIDRGLPLPLLAYEAALGRSDLLEEVRHRLRKESYDGRSRVYTHSVILRMMTQLQGLAGTMTVAEVVRWQDWYRSNRHHMSDAVIDSVDWLPAVVDVAATVARYGRHPRSFVRSMILDR